MKLCKGEFDCMIFTSAGEFSDRLKIRVEDA